MIGCSRTHSKEIDIYNKPFPEKIARIKAMKEEGNKHYKNNELDKASYYYAQALLVFHYLIPDSPEEEKESSELKRTCHLNQSICFFKQSRHKEALNEINQALKIMPGDPKALYRRAQIHIKTTEFELAKSDIK